MKRHGTIAATIALVVLTVVGSTMAAEVDFVINALPSSLLINMEDSFAVVDSDGSRLALSSVYFMPNISAGVGLDLETFFIDATAGVGLVVNESFQTFMLQAALAVLWAASDSLQIGPHIGLIHFTNPEWQESADLEVDDTTGWFAGMEMTIGDRIMYMISVDIISAEFDFEADPGVEPESDVIDLMALTVQFGVRGEF